jgi:hypothetical protein
MEEWKVTMAYIICIRKNTFALELLRTMQNVVSTQEHLQAPRSSWELLGASGKLSDISFIRKNTLVLRRPRVF